MDISIRQIEPKYCENCGLKHGASLVGDETVFNVVQLLGALWLCQQCIQAPNQRRYYNARTGEPISRKGQGIIEIANIANEDGQYD